MNQKGFTYIIVSIIIVMSVSALLITSKSNVYKNENYKKMDYLVQNFDNEFNYITSQTNMDEYYLEKSFENLYNYLKTQVDDIEFCAIIGDQDNFYFVNYCENRCEIIHNNEVISKVDFGSLKKIDRFLNKTNIHLCNCEYINDDIYILKIISNKNQIVKNKK